MDKNSHTAQDALFSNEMYRQLFDKSLAVQLLIQPETGRILDANPAACTFYGYDREVLRDLFITDLNTLSAGQVAAEMQATKREERKFFRFQHRLASGDVRDVEVYSTPIQVGAEILLHSIILDIKRCGWKWKRI